MSPTRPSPPASTPDAVVEPAAPGPLDAARALLADLPPPDMTAEAQARSDLRRFAPLGGLGEVAAWLAAWAPPGPVRRPLFALYVSSYAGDPEAPARARAAIERLAAGGGAVSALARSLGAGVEAFDLALDRPTPHPRERAPMTVRETAATLAFGMEALAKGPDLLVLSDATEGSAEVAALAAEALGPGEGALARLPQLAGREVSALAGAVLAARVQRTPVILESPAALLAAAVLASERPGAADHCRAAARSPLQARLGIAPIEASAEGASEPGVAGAAALSACRLAAELVAAARETDGVAFGAAGDHHRAN